MSLFDFTTSVPMLRLTDHGFEAPTETDILAGLQADINAALGGAANMAVDTPQGQIATTMTAIIADCNDQMVALLNGIDPFLASGQMQDAIGALYLMSRLAAAPTRVEAVLTGTPSFRISKDTPIATDGTFSYKAAQDITLSLEGSATAWLYCDVDGAHNCLPGTLRLYRNVSGLLGVTNAHAGIPGRPVEDRIAFERRRQQTLSSNAAGTNAAILGALLTLKGVSDAWVTDNASDEPMSLGEIILPAGHLFICVAGGDEAEIGQVILKKKPPCCPTFGDVAVTVPDAAEAYRASRPEYTFRFSRPKDVAVYVTVTMLQNDRIPADALEQVQKAVMRAAMGEGSVAGMRIGATVLASRFQPVIQALGTWAQIVSITLHTQADAGKVAVEQPMLSMEVYQMPFVRADTILLVLEGARHD